MGMSYIVESWWFMQWLWMATEIIKVRMHYKGFLKRGFNARYEGGEVAEWDLDKDHLSIIEIFSFAAELKHFNLNSFLVPDPNGFEFLEVSTDLALMDFTRTMKNGDTLDIFLDHVISEVVGISNPSDVDVLEYPTSHGKNSYKEVICNTGEDVNRQRSKQTQFDKGKSVCTYKGDEIGYENQLKEDVE